MNGGAAVGAPEIDAETIYARGPEPLRHCPICPRLVAYREENRAQQPTWWNGPAPSWGDPQARLLVLGLAPGRAGANRTGRPFTGDFAGVLLYATLGKFGFAQGRYAADPDDGFELLDCMVSNAVRCAPPGNRPTAAEEASCRPFLEARLEALPNLRAVVALGDVARNNFLRAIGEKPSLVAPGHGVRTTVGNYQLFSSYHCSRLNTNTGRLTPLMFESVFDAVRRLLDR